MIVVSSQKFETMSLPSFLDSAAQNDVDAKKEEIKAAVSQNSTLGGNLCNAIWKNITNFCRLKSSDINIQNTYYLAFGILCIPDRYFAIHDQTFKELLQTHSTNKVIDFMYKIHFRQVDQNKETLTQFEQMLNQFRLNKKQFRLFVNSRTPLSGEYTDVIQIYPTLNSYTHSTSSIHLSISHIDCKPVAIKRFDETLTANEYINQCIERQNELTQAYIFHPSILQLIDQGWHGDYYCFVNPFCAYGTIAEDIERRNPTSSVYTDDELLIYAYQLITALSLMHQSGFLHRDIKPSNLFLRTRNWLVLGDFGLVKKSDKNSQSTNVGTYMYVSPETIRLDKSPLLNVSQPSDIYSFGMTLYHMRSLQAPFPGKTPAEVCQDVLDGYRPYLNPEKKINKLIMDCWKDNPDDRPTAEEVIQRIEEIWDESHPEGPQIHEVVENIYNQEFNEWNTFLEATKDSQKSPGYWDAVKKLVQSDQCPPSIASTISYLFEEEDEDPLF